MANYSYSGPTHGVSESAGLENEGQKVQGGGVEKDGQN